MENSSQAALKPATIIAYIVSVDDSSVKGKKRYILSRKINIAAAYVDVNGFELDKTQAVSIKGKTEIDSIANSGEKVNYYFPWHRVINIRPILG